VTTLPQSPERPFDEPWQARAFAMAVVTVERFGLPWDAFRDRLKAAVADDPHRPYWESWLTALEDLLGTGHPAGAGDPVPRDLR
jgi:hypothetical protein